MSTSKPKGPPPSWIDRVKEKDGTVSYRVNEITGKTIREIVSYRLDGLSLSQIASRLNDPSQPGGVRTTRTGSLWTVERVQQILSQEYRDKMSEGAFPALLSPEEIEKLNSVQTELAASRQIGGAEKQTRKRREVQIEGLCDDLLHCFYCKSRLQMAHTVKGHRMMRCPRSREGVGAQHPVRDMTTGGTQVRGMMLKVQRVEQAVYVGLQFLAWQAAAQNPSMSKLQGLTPQEMDAIPADTERGTSNWKPGHLRKELKRLVERIEVPVTIPGLSIETGSPIEHVRMFLKTPLPNRTNAILVEMRRSGYKGYVRAVMEII